MKKSPIIFVFALLVICLEANSQDLIQGKWEVDVTKTIDGIPDFLKPKYDSISHDVKQLISAELSNREIVFGADSSYLLTTDYETLEGTWSFEGDYINIITVEGEELSQGIISTTTDSLVIEIISDPDSETFFHNLYLNLIER